MDKDGYHGYYRNEPVQHRTWVGLTDEERHELVRVFLGYYKDFKTTDAFIMLIERLIKEKNT